MTGASRRHSSRTDQPRHDRFRIVYFAPPCRRCRLDAVARNPHALPVSRPDGRSRYGRKVAGEESPGSIDIRCRITTGGGDPRDSATENEPLAFALRGFGAVRVKRCGKSAPRFRQRKRHGKPHREQNRIGTATQSVRSPQAKALSDNTAGRCLARRPGRLLEAACKCGPRGMAVTYRPGNRAVPYKTRLTGRLILFTTRGSAKDAGPLASLQLMSFRGAGGASRPRTSATPIGVAGNLKMVAR
jgi:hypothetical protein